MGFRTIQLKDSTYNKLKTLKNVFGKKGSLISFNEVVAKLVNFYDGK